MNTQTTRTERAYDPDACVRWAYRQGLSLRKLQDNRNAARFQLSTIFILFGAIFGSVSLPMMQASLYGGIATGLTSYLLLRKGTTTLAWLYQSERAARDEQFTTGVEIEETRDGANCTITRGTADVREYSSRTSGVSVGHTWDRPCVFIDIDEAAVGDLDHPLQAGHALEHAVIKEHCRQQDTINIGGQTAHESTLSDSGTNIVFHFGNGGDPGVLYEEFERVLQDARDVLAACVCPGSDGCYNCCHTRSCSEGNKMLNASEAVELADRLLQE